MDLFSFTAHFGNEELFRLHFKGEQDKIDIVCTECDRIEHFGSKADGAMNIRNIGIMLL